MDTQGLPDKIGQDIRDQEWVREELREVASR